MSDTNNEGSGVPWASIAAAAMVLAGAMLALTPLKSARPAAKTGIPAESAAVENLDARLWEDPFTAVDKRQRSATREGKEGSVPNSPILCGKQMLERYRKSHNLDDRDILILPVILPGSPYADYVELRLRRRQAVLHGLATGGYAPEDGNHIGCIRLTCPADSTSDAPSLLVPFEWCTAMFNLCHGRSDVKDSEPVAGTRRVLVLWLQEESLLPRPLANLNSLLAQLGRNTETPVRIVGPSSSQGLQAMLNEATQETRKGPEAELNDISIFAATPRTSDEILRLGLLPQFRAQPTNQLITTYAAGPDRFYRITATDDQVAQALAQELARRGVKTGRDHIALISEWDTLYGRALPLTFAAKFSDKSVDQLARSFEGLRQADSAWPVWIHRYSYLRGLDGQTLDDQGRDEANPEERRTRREDSPRALLPAEKPEGTHQLDYLRRLTTQLEQLDQRLRSQGSRLRAVGVLGNDIYDKLLILHALRAGSLPGVLFFTNDMDSRFMHPDEWTATRNLIVASAYGLLPDEKFQRQIAPFRDSYQTAMFTATLQALGAIPEGTQREVKVYEIGRNAPHQFSVRDSPSEERPLAWWSAARVLALAILLPLAGLLMAIALVALRDAEHSKEKNGDQQNIGLAPRLRTFASWLGHTAAPSPSVPLAAAIFCGLILLILHFNRTEIQEPFYLLQGISVWPSVVLRLYALLLGIHFLARAIKDLHENDNRLSTDYCFVDGGREPESSPENGGYSACTLWTQYHRLGKASSRASRWVPTAICFLLFGMGLVYLLGAPSNPCRGTSSRIAHFATLYPSVLVMVLLIFFVIDATLLSSWFTSRLSAGTTGWPEKLLDRYRTPEGRRRHGSHEQGVDQECLTDYLDISLVAERTAAVSKLIYYPFIVLALMIFARFGWFEDWGWQTSMLVVLGLSSAGAVFSVLILRHAAEHARRKVLLRMRTDWAQALTKGEDGKADCIEKLMQDVQSERRGAFASFWRQPALTAILLPAIGMVWSFVQ